MLLLGQCASLGGLACTTHSTRKAPSRQPPIAAATPEEGSAADRPDRPSRKPRRRRLTVPRPPSTSRRAPSRPRSDEPQPWTSDGAAEAAAAQRLLEQLPPGAQALMQQLLQQQLEQQLRQQGAGQGSSVGVQGYDAGILAQLQAGVDNPADAPLLWSEQQWGAFMGGMLKELLTLDQVALLDRVCGESWWREGRFDQAAMAAATQRGMSEEEQQLLLGVMERAAELQQRIQEVAGGVQELAADEQLLQPQLQLQQQLLQQEQQQQLQPPKAAGSWEREQVAGPAGAPSSGSSSDGSHPPSSSSSGQSSYSSSGWDAGTRAGAGAGFGGGPFGGAGGAAWAAAAAAAQEVAAGLGGNMEAKVQRSVGSGFWFQTFSISSPSCLGPPATTTVPLH